MNPGWTEILIIALVILLLFGGRKIPELMKGLGKGVKSFKDGLREGDSEDMHARLSSAAMPCSSSGCL